MSMTSTLDSLQPFSQLRDFRLKRHLQMFRDMLIHLLPPISTCTRPRYSLAAWTAWGIGCTSPFLIGGKRDASTRYATWRSMSARSVVVHGPVFPWWVRDQHL